MIRIQSWITAMHFILDARLATLFSICINRLKLLICCKIFSHVTLITKRREKIALSLFPNWYKVGLSKPHRIAYLVALFQFHFKKLRRANSWMILAKEWICFVCIMAQSSRFIWTKHKSKRMISRFENQHMITIWPLFGTLMQCTYHLFFAQSRCHVFFLFVDNL